MFQFVSLTCWILNIFKDNVNIVFFFRSKKYVLSTIEKVKKKYMSKIATNRSCNLNHLRFTGRYLSEAVIILGNVAVIEEEKNYCSGTEDDCQMSSSKPYKIKLTKERKPLIRK